ncbi:MAG: hypothetical protein ACFFD3_06290 [Candidatus Thorarchaeota archaeon]
MQDYVALAVLLREISFGVLIIGLFYTFGMFLLGRVFSAFSEHESDVDHGAEHDVDHDIDHDIDHDVDHDIDHDIDHDVDHDIDHDVDHDIDHDVDHDIEKDLEHHVEKDFEKDAEHDMEKDVGIDHGEAATDHSGFFEMGRGAPLGVTIGTSLVSFGFLGAVIYYEGLMIPFAAKFIIHILGAFFVVYSIRTVLGRIFVESGFLIGPRNLVGQQVEAVSSISDGFGEIRTETEMGLRRFHARPFTKGGSFKKGDILWVISANEKFVYVDPSKDIKKWAQEQSRAEKK